MDPISISLKIDFGTGLLTLYGIVIFLVVGSGDVSIELG